MGGRWGRARSAPAAEKLPGRPWHRPAGETYLWRLPPVARHCPLSLAGAGSPAAPGMQQTEREPLGWGGREEPGGEEEEEEEEGRESPRWARRPQLSCTQPGSPGQRTASK